MKSQNRFFKRALRLHNVVVLGIYVRINRNPQHEIGVSDSPEPFRKLPIIKQAAVREDMDRRARQLFLAALYQAYELVLQKSRLSASDHQLSRFRIDQVYQADVLCYAIKIIDLFRRLRAH